MLQVNSSAMYIIDKCQAGWSIEKIISGITSELPTEEQEETKEKTIDFLKYALAIRLLVIKHG